MKHEYRIIENEKGFYAQTRYKVLFFWSGWYRISHLLKEKDVWLMSDLDFPLPTYDEAYELIQEYKKRNKSKFVKITKVE